MLDMHTNVATALLEEIKVHKLQLPEYLNVASLEWWCHGRDEGLISSLKWKKR